MATPSPSPSPTPAGSAVGASPSPSHQPSTKAGALVSAAKTLLSEQSARLSLKHNTDLDLLDDLRVYLKTRCSIERDYAQALSKLAASGHSKRTNQLLSYVATVDEEDTNTKTLYTTWRLYQEELEKHAKFRQSSFEQLGAICDQLKAMRAHKLQMSKKCLDNHLKKMQEELINSINEIDKTRKMYFEEEHLARQARDKEEKLKKGKGGIFSSFMNLQNKKERSSAHREASDIQSTQARNDYLMALAAGNAHLEHYYSQDLANLMLTIDDQVLDRIRNFLLAILSAENDVNGGWSEVITTTMAQVEKSSADYTNTVFLRDPNSQLLIEASYYEFQPCDGDPMDTISLDHNADIALKNEGQKWFQWFSKECRNLNRLSAQLVRVQAMASEGHRTVEVSGSGQVDIETRIDEIRQQIRKCEVSKLKARARLLAIRESGAQVEDFEAFEAAVAQEIKQQSLDVDLTIGGLSRTPSMKSTSDLRKSESESHTQHQSVQQQQSQHPQYRPESSSSAEQLDSPDREVLQFGSSIECNSPAPTSAAYTNTAASWDAYDPTAAWTEEPAAPAANSNVAVGSGYDSQQQDEDQLNESNETSGWTGEAYIQETVTTKVKHGELTSTLTTTTVTSQELYYDETSGADYGQEEHEAVDGFTLVGKQCYAVYSYAAQNEGDLSVQEQDIVNVIEALDKDWVQAQNSSGEYGYLPASYLQALPNQDTQQESTTDDWGYQPQEQSSSLAEITPVTAAVPAPATQFSESTDISSASGPGAAASSGPIMAKAIYEYEATNDEEISFAAGEMIEIIDDSSDDGWWTGKNVRTGLVGHFPSMLVKEINGGDGENEESDDDDEEDEDEDEDEDEELSEIVKRAPPALPPMLPPVLPPPVPAPSPILPVIVDCADDKNKQIDTPSRPNPPTGPMQLIPQTVVIIQPTPEIESKPNLGSEEEETEEMPPPPLFENNDEDDAIQQEVKISKFNGNNNSNNAAPSAAIEAAAREISETITQQAIDDSVRELSRRTSTSSNNTETITVHDIIRENGNIVENGNAEPDVETVIEEDEENFR